MTGKAIAVFVLICVIMLPETLFAARPMSTDDAGTVEKGATEIEAGYDFESGQVGGAQCASVQIGHGITEKMDIKVAFPYSISPVRGTEGVSLGIKLALAGESGSLPGVAISVSLNPGEKQYTLNCIISKSFEQLGVHLNLGYKSAGVAGEKGVYIYSIAADYAVTDNLSVVAEVCDSTKESLVHHSVTPFLGVRLAAVDWVRVDAGAGVNLSDASLPYQITAGTTILLQ